MKTSHLQTLAMGRELFRAGDHLGARSYLAESLAVFPEMADVHRMLGLIDHETGHPRSAVEHLERAVSLNPRYTEAALDLAVCYNEVGRYGDAREVYARAVHGSGTPRETNVEELDRMAAARITNLHLDLGDSYLAVGETERAAEHFRTALAINPLFPDVRLKMATTLRDLGKVDEALDLLFGLRQEQPGFIPARLQLGVTFWVAGRVAEARQEWESVLERDPKNRSARFYLAALSDPKPVGT